MQPLKRLHTLHQTCNWAGHCHIFHVTARLMSKSVSVSVSVIVIVIVLVLQAVTFHGHVNDKLTPTTP
jgi:hypothetical protein